MNRPLALALLAGALLLGWLAGRTGTAPAGAAPAEAGLRHLALIDGDCDTGGAACIRVTASWLELTGGGTATPRLNEQLRALVVNVAGEQEAVADPARTARRLVEENRRFRAEFPEAATGRWFDERSTTLLLLSPAALSVRVDWSAYMGGAHPNTAATLASFDPATGRRLELGDLLAAGFEEPLRHAAEAAFRSARGLPPDRPLADAGFWFEDGRFVTPTRWALSADGLLFRFDPYEVGPWSAGPTEFVVGTGALRSALAEHVVAGSALDSLLALRAEDPSMG